jgi:hypothetical protein
MADLITFMCRLSRNLEALSFWNSQGLSRPVMGLLYLRCPLGRHSGFLLLVITIFLEFRFSTSGVRFDPRWTCTCYFSVFSFVHFCVDCVL